MKLVSFYRGDNIVIFYILKEKGRDLTQSYDKSPYTNRNVKDHLGVISRDLE